MLQGGSLQYAIPFTSLLNFKSFLWAWELDTVKTNVFLTEFYRGETTQIANYWHMHELH